MTKAAERRRNTQKYIAKRKNQIKNLSWCPNSWIETEELNRLSKTAPFYCGCYYCTHHEPSKHELQEKARLKSALEEIQEER